MRKIHIDLDDHEEIKHEGPATFLKGIEGVGGKLLLTNKRLVFKSHKLNIQTGETIVSLESLQAASPRKTANLFQNGIRILDNSGKTLDFVVYEREKWLKKISELKLVS